MTTQQQKRNPVVEELSEEAIAHYLQTHPEFFDHHDRLLASLHLPHRAGNAVSLIERQVTILRTRAAKLESKLRELLEEGRANETRATKTYKLAGALIAAADRAGVLQAIESSLREDFGIEHVVLLLFVAECRQAGGERRLRALHRFAGSAPHRHCLAARSGRSALRAAHRRAALAAVRRDGHRLYGAGADRARRAAGWACSPSAAPIPIVSCRR